VAGLTTSNQATFPAFGGPDVTYNGGQDGFVAKVNPAGTGLEYAGYIGGVGAELAGAWRSTAPEGRTCRG
jgi:trimeric autotransporter adhesin